MYRKLRESLRITNKLYFVSLMLIFFIPISTSCIYKTEGNKFQVSPENDPPPITYQKDASLTDRVEETINSMSTEEMVGQLVMVGFSGTEPDYYVTRMINLRHAGSIILYGRNIKDPIQVAKLNNALQEISLTSNKLPLFIAVDQEGGEINRFKEGITIFPTPPELGKLASEELTELAAKDTAAELKAVGINVNLAPVIDIAQGKSIMAGRSYGTAIEPVTKLGTAAVQGYRQGGVIPCVKHFPGLGRAIYDTHDVPVVINSNLNALDQMDLVPFRAAIKENVEMIIVSHALYPALDDKNPASYSFAVQTNLLREKLCYEGLILSDDLEMGAVRNQKPIGQLAVEAVKAGTDIVLVCHTPKKQKEVYDSLLQAVKSGEIDNERLKQSMRRIISLKLNWELDKNNQANLDAVTQLVKTPAHQRDALLIKEQLKELNN